MYLNQKKNHEVSIQLYYKNINCRLLTFSAPGGRRRRSVPDRGRRGKGWEVQTHININGLVFETEAAGIVQSVQRFATGWTVRGSNPGGGEIFHTRPGWPWGPPSLLYNGYRVFRGSKAAGAWC